MRRNVGMALLLLAVYAAAGSSFPSTSTSLESGGPMTKKDFQTLVDSGARPDAIIKIIQRQGVGFLPTPAILKKLKDANVHEDIRKELTIPETYSKNLRVRICQYSSPANLAEQGQNFANTLRNYLSNAKLGPNVEADWPLLRGIPLESEIGPIDCFDRIAPQNRPYHPKEKGQSYVTIRGSISSRNGRVVADTIFTYFPLDANEEPLGPSSMGLSLSLESAKQIVREAMTRLENKLK